MTRLIGGAIVVFLAVVIAFSMLKIPLAEGLRLVAQGAAGDRFGLFRTVVRATPLVLTGLGVAVAWRAGALNIGGEGQYIVGGLSAAAVMPHTLGWPVGLGLTAGVLAAALGGGAYAWLAGWMSTARGVPVVISTILLNFIAAQLLDGLIRGPLQESTGRLPQTLALDRSRLFPVLDAQADANWSVALPIAATLILAVLLKKTIWGFSLRAVGANPLASETFGLKTSRVQMGALAVSGGLCGLAASCEYLGVSGTIDSGFSQGWGFVGIPVALLGGLTAFGSLLAGTLFGGLYAGSDKLSSFVKDGPAMVLVVQALAVLGLVGFQAWSARRRAT